MESINCLNSKQTNFEQMCYFDFIWSLGNVKGARIFASNSFPNTVSALLSRKEPFFLIVTWTAFPLAILLYLLKRRHVNQNWAITDTNKEPIRRVERLITWEAEKCLYSLWIRKSNKRAYVQHSISIVRDMSVRTFRTYSYLILRLKLNWKCSVLRSVELIFTIYYLQEMHSLISM